MAGTLSERLANGALVLSDTAQIKSQFPEWLRREIEDASHLMGEAAELARRVEAAPRAVVIGKRVALVEVSDRGS